MRGFQEKNTFFRNLSPISPQEIYFGYFAPNHSSLKSESEVPQLCPTLCDPMDYSLPGSFIHGIFQQEYWSGLPFPPLGDLPDPGIEPCLPHCSQTLYRLSHHRGKYAIAISPVEHFTAPQLSLQTSRNRRLRQQDIE